MTQGVLQPIITVRPPVSCVMSRSRTFTFTMNNYKDTNLVDNIDCKYVIYGKEVGEQGTPHLQGTIVFDNARRLAAVIKDMPGCHIEVCRSVQHSIEYCKKEGDWKERGAPPKTAKEGGEMEQERWKRIREAAESGEFDKIPDKVRIQQARNLEYIYQQASKLRKLEDTEVKHEWYWGKAGTGKSRKAREENPDAYLKMCNKWWDGYQDEDVVVIEDFDKKHDVLVHHVKIWADRYPFLAEIKGGAKKIRPKKIIVTSNYHPRDIWVEENDLEPVLRRFACIEFKCLQ